MSALASVNSSHPVFLKNFVISEVSWTAALSHPLLVTQIFDISSCYCQTLKIKDTSMKAEGKDLMPQGQGHNFYPVQYSHNSPWMFSNLINI